MLNNIIHLLWVSMQWFLATTFWQREKKEREPNLQNPEVLDAREVHFSDSGDVVSVQIPAERNTDVRKYVWTKPSNTWESTLARNCLQCIFIAGNFARQIPEKQANYRLRGAWEYHTEYDTVHKDNTNKPKHTNTPTVQAPGELCTHSCLQTAAVNYWEANFPAKKTGMKYFSLSITRD